MENNNLEILGLAEVKDIVFNLYSHPGAIFVCLPKLYLIFYNIPLDRFLSSDLILFLLSVQRMIDSGCRSWGGGICYQTFQLKEKYCLDRYRLSLSRSPGPGLLFQIYWWRSKNPKPCQRFDERIIEPKGVKYDLNGQQKAIRVIIKAILTKGNSINQKLIGIFVYQCIKRHLGGGRNFMLLNFFGAAKIALKIPFLYIKVQL